MRSFVRFAIVFAVAFAGTSARAGDCCDRCRCQCDCTKICRLVCDVKKVPKVEYDCECEDFCVPGKSERCVTHDECGNRKVTYTPTCATVRSRVKLIKKEKSEDVTSYKWVVEDLCKSCAKRCAADDAAVQSGAAVDRRAADVRAASHAEPETDRRTATEADLDALRAGGNVPAPLRGLLSPLFGR